MVFQQPRRRGRFPPERRASRLPADSLERTLKPARTDLVELMLSSTGRLSRAAFLGAAAALLALAMAFEYARAALGVDARWGWVVYAVLLFSAACVI